MGVRKKDCRPHCPATADPRGKHCRSQEPVGNPIRQYVLYVISTTHGKTISKFGSAKAKRQCTFAKHIHRREQDGEEQEGQDEEDISTETEYKIQTPSDEEDEDETPPQVT